MSGGGDCGGQAASGEDLRRRLDFVFSFVGPAGQQHGAAGLCFFIFMKMIAMHDLHVAHGKGQ
jgi:hypothetical protein